MRGMGVIKSSYMNCHPPYRKQYLRSVTERGVTGEGLEKGRLPSTLMFLQIEGKQF